MTIRSNLKEVFDECKKKGLNVELGESYCSSIKSSTPHSGGIGWVNAEAEDDDRIMEDIEGEGSAEVSWLFGPPEKMNVVGNILLNAFIKKGYIVVWNMSMGCRISAVIEEEDLPLSFLEGWANESESEPEEEEPEEESEEEEPDDRVSPEKEVIFSKQEEEQALIFNSDDEDEDDDEEEDDDENNTLIIDLDSDEEDT
jgi:hypothetical protein